uniref:Uncharacterized protein n=1 Tax=Glossina pallidipes TaxID=7398 RepID=A0A1A9ZE74_GLOPL
MGLQLHGYYLVVHDGRDEYLYYSSGKNYADDDDDYDDDEVLWDLTATIFAGALALFVSPHTTIETRRDFRFAISAGSCKTSSSELLTVSTSFSIPLPSQLSSSGIGKGSIASGTFGDGLFVRSFSNDRVLLKLGQLLELSFDIIFTVDTNDAAVFKFVACVGCIIGVSPSPMAINFSTSICGSKSIGGSFSDSSGNGYSAGFKCWETIFSKYDKDGTVACKSLNSFATNSIGVRGVKGPTKLGSVVSEPYISVSQPQILAPASPSSILQQQ